AGGAAVVDLLQRACAAADSDVTAWREQVAELATDAYERSWEQLHCGSWKSIASVWRQAFGFAGVLQKPRLVLYEEQGVDFPVRRLAMPSLEEFRRDVMQRNSPVIITDAMEFWPALGRAGGAGRSWKDLQYLRRVAGWRTVPIEVRLCRIPALARDIITPDYCTVPRIENDEDEDIAVNAWFGPGGTVSPLHFDPKDNLLCQVVGAKYLRLYAPEESDKLYPVEGLLSNTSQVQVEAPDEERFPDFHGAAYLECVLKEGEMLYIPPGYWHYVKSLDTSFSVSFWWT
ncbi:hypothetical protein BBJ28_00018010, partial [Nothophytophthora sp. Chile5]